MILDALLRDSPFALVAVSLAALLALGVAALVGGYARASRRRRDARRERAGEGRR